MTGYRGRARSNYQDGVLRVPQLRQRGPRAAAARRARAGGPLPPGARGAAQAHAGAPHQAARTYL